jgi:hypothetical protein
MVKRRNSQYDTFYWGALRDRLIDPMAVAAATMPVAALGRTHKQRAWSASRPEERFVIQFNGIAPSVTRVRSRAAGEIRETSRWAIDTDEASTRLACSGS